MPYDKTKLNELYAQVREHINLLNIEAFSLNEFTAWTENLTTLVFDYKTEQSQCILMSTAETAVKEAIEENQKKEGS